MSTLQCQRKYNVKIFILNSKGDSGLPWSLSSKESTCQCRRYGFHPWFEKISWREKQQLTPVFLPGKSNEQRSLASYSPWGCKELDMTEDAIYIYIYTHTHTHTYTYIDTDIWVCKFVCIPNIFEYFYEECMNFCHSNFRIC